MTLPVVLGVKCDKCGSWMIDFSAKYNHYGRHTITEMNWSHPHGVKCTNAVTVVFGEGREQ